MSNKSLSHGNVTKFNFNPGNGNLSFGSRSVTSPASPIITFTIICGILLLFLTFFVHKIFAIFLIIFLTVILIVLLYTFFKRPTLLMSEQYNYQLMQLFYGDSKRGITEATPQDDLYKVKGSTRNFVVTGVEKPNES